MGDTRLPRAPVRGIEHDSKRILSHNPGMSRGLWQADAAVVTSNDGPLSGYDPKAIRFEMVGSDVSLDLKVFERLGT